jgi:hypothetical protein
MALQRDAAKAEIVLKDIHQRDFKGAY